MRGAGSISRRTGCVARRPAAGSAYGRSGSPAAGGPGAARSRSGAAGGAGAAASGSGGGETIVASSGPGSAASRAGGEEVGSASKGAADSTVASASGASGAAPSPSLSDWRCAASVARKSSASGPSRMLARRRAIEHLLREVTVRLCGGALRVVLEHGAALHRRFRVAHGLADPRLEDELAEVLLQHLDRLLG